MSRGTEGVEDAEGAEKASSESIVGREIVAKEHHKLFHHLKNSVKKFLGNLIDQHDINTKIDDLNRKIDELEEQSKRYKSVRMSEMSLKNVQQCLHLQLDEHDTEMKDVQSLLLPLNFVTTLGLIEKAFGHSRTTEASARWVVDSIILNAYATATSNIKNAQPLNVQCERGYNFGPVTLNRKRVMLAGRPDYSVWYGESEALCLNVLIVEAKGGAKASNPISQLLGYMGCIHRTRKDEQKRNCGVYGMAYTGFSWHFLKISHESKVSWFISAKDTILISTSGRNFLLPVVGTLSRSRSVC